ncbi:MAG: Obg family GTPase CgtA [Candidatus Zapsychrus exili]|nr:Obg family GTPase CgtA [Candidatus Zapsychrus exili]
MIFVDEARIFIEAASGGRGCESFHVDRSMRHPRPDGGDGGHGGDIIFVASRSMHTLLDFRYKQHYKSQSGAHASSRGKRGKNGKNCILRVPVGTIISDHETGLQIKDLTEDGQEVVVAKGGRGGIGNEGKKVIKPPRDGEKLTIKLELKVIADVGLVGFPNAGKSTIITKISKVKSQIANYPFTTKHPILGIVFDEFEESSFIVADLPGIIEGAHTGKGLGDRFLRHAERTKILVHVLDMAATEDRDPLEDYAKLNNELEKYSDNFAFKHKIVVANKMDLEYAAEYLERFKEKYKEDIIPVSAVEASGLDKLVDVIRNTLIKDAEEQEQDAGEDQ